MKPEAEGVGDSSGSSKTISRPVIALLRSPGLVMRGVVLGAPFSVGADGVGAGRSGPVVGDGRDPGSGVTMTWALLRSFRIL